MTSPIAPVRFEGDRLVLLDQTLLPGREVERAYTRWEDVAEAIRTLVVRGAPAIGVAAAFGVVLAARASQAPSTDALLADLEAAVKGLGATRPTAVNLFWALDRMTRVAEALRARPVDEVRARLAAEAHAILAEDLAANRALGDHGAVLARHHGVPFYIAAPFSTIDPTLASGAEIPIEERDAVEVRRVGLQQTAPEGSPVYNPAFDVTPAALIAAIITERGVFRPPYRF